MLNLTASQCGEFIFRIPKIGIVVQRNTIVKSGALLFLQSLFQSQSVLPSSLYLGLCNSTYTYATTLADVTATEPTTGGYARIAVARNVDNWTLSAMEYAYMIESKQVTFTATADWDKTWTQAFICDAASGSTGNLIAISKILANPVQVEAGTPPSISWRHYIRGTGSEA